MKFCSSCGTTLSDQARFCSSCGTAVEAAPASREREVRSGRKKVVFGLLSVLFAAGIATTAFAVGQGSGDADNESSGAGQLTTQASSSHATYEACVADPKTPNYLCQGLPRASGGQAPSAPVSDPGYQSCVETLRYENEGVQGAGLSEAEMAAGCQPGGQFRTAADCHDDTSCAAAEAEIESTQNQPNSCLEWHTNYAQRYVTEGLGALGGSSWDGSRWVQNSPQTGHWEQYPTGQTCVRYG